ncbi:hypothetical protein AAG747_28360 [Rapidithrix thailandica]|uniref:ATP synthase protein MI25 n=1 Tax=Rapidithrix thailandica TaxID=413964 RepID=A0AAW9SHA6_9BACT
MPEELTPLLEIIKRFGLVQVLCGVLVFALLQQRKALATALVGLFQACSQAIRAFALHLRQEVLQKISGVYELMNRLAHEFSCMQVAVLKIHGERKKPEDLHLSIFVELTGKYEDGRLVEPLKPLKQKQPLNKQALNYLEKMLKSLDKDLYIDNVDLMPSGRAKLELLSTEAKAVYHLYLEAEPEKLYTLILVFNRKTPLSERDKTRIRNFAHQIRKLLV